MPPPRVAVTAPPRVSGSALRPLWQAPLRAIYTVSDGLVIVASSIGGRDAVAAVSALTGAGVWAAPVPRSVPDVVGFVADGTVGVIEAGREIGKQPDCSGDKHCPALLGPEATTEIAVDITTGRRLWIARLPGPSQSIASAGENGQVIGGIPPVAVAGNEVLAGSATGMIIARNAQTGRILWSRPGPAGCNVAGGGMSLAADGALVAASYICADSVVVQRLDPRTGIPAWRWSSPSAAYLTLVGVANDGDLVLLKGGDLPLCSALCSESTASPLARLVRRSYVWPSSLGPVGSADVLLALSAVSGHPRWLELGGQQEDLALTDGAVCEIANTGLECRDDVTGAETRPVLVTGQGAGAMPPYGDDGWAGISGSLAAVTVSPWRAGRVTVELAAVRGRRTLGRAVLDIGVIAHNANYKTYIVGAGTLPGGGTVLLLRRIDLPGYPIVALRVASA
jgi:hypothetical protein